ncbi:HigA family addiction module antitoxin [Burkholderia sp. PAMC 26561]|uniref:HigA family addiction module antitoxin n=1 Tax=Burkholderia sp. PAMC 26561 TaxID=1795043 RepID=UPI0030013811
MDQVTASFDRMHEEHVEQQWVRHGEFVAQLRDPNFAQAVVAAALRHVEEWEAGKEPSAQRSGWRAVLAMEPELIAAILEENAHPILHIRHGRSPFWRDLSEAEDRQLREETAHPRVQKKPAGSSHDKCRLSVDEISNWLYRSVMSDTDFSHPGTLVRQNCLERFELSVTECARALGVSRQALTNLLGGKAGISPEMALRLDLAFGGGAETWLQRQLLHDLSEARKRLAQFKVVPIASERQPALF